MPRPCGAARDPIRLFVPGKFFLKSHHVSQLPLEGLHSLQMRILIGLIEHMGDIVACEPVARYMRYNYPDSHITWAVSEPFRELIDTNPFIDETLVLGCLTDWMKLTKHGSHDKVVDLHVNYRICEHCRIPLIKRPVIPSSTPTSGSIMARCWRRFVRRRTAAPVGSAYALPAT